MNLNIEQTVLQKVKNLVHSRLLVARAKRRQQPASSPADEMHYAHNTNTTTRGKGKVDPPVASESTTTFEEYLTITDMVIIPRSSSVLTCNTNTTIKGKLDHHPTTTSETTASIELMKMPPTSPASSADMVIMPQSSSILACNCNTNNIKRGQLDPPTSSESTASIELMKLSPPSPSSADIMIMPQSSSEEEVTSTAVEISNKTTSKFALSPTFVPPTAGESTKSELMKMPPPSIASCSSIEKMIMPAPTAKILCNSSITTRGLIDPPAASYESITSIELMKIPPPLCASSLEMMIVPSISSARACNELLPILETNAASQLGHMIPITSYSNCKNHGEELVSISALEFDSMSEGSKSNSAETSMPPPSFAPSSEMMITKPAATSNQPLPIVDDFASSMSTSLPSCNHLGEGEEITTEIDNMTTVSGSITFMPLPSNQPTTFSIESTELELMKMPPLSPVCSLGMIMPTTTSVQLCNQSLPLPILKSVTASRLSAASMGFTMETMCHARNCEDNLVTFEIDVMTANKASVSSATGSMEMILPPSGIHAQHLYAQASSFPNETTKQQDVLNTIDDHSDSWTLDSLSIGSFCLSDIIADATATQAELLREAEASEKKHANKEILEEIEMAATAHAEILFEETVSTVLNHTTNNISTTSPLSSSGTITTFKISKLVSKRSVMIKWRPSSHKKAASQKAKGGMNQQPSPRKRRMTSTRSTSHKPEIARCNNVFELSEDRLHSYKVKTDGKLSRCVRNNGTASQF